MSCRQLFSHLGAEPAQERLRSLKDGRGKGKRQRQAAAGKAGHATEYRGPYEDSPDDTAERPFGSAGTISQPKLG
jgi:hypothetical protein